MGRILFAVFMHETATRVSPPLRPDTSLSTLHRKDGLDRPQFGVGGVGPGVSAALDVERENEARPGA